MKNLLLAISIAFFALPLTGQYYYAVKGGMGLNFQKWNSFERDILFTPFLDLMVESHDDEYNKLYASIGYHTRGSGIRGFGFSSFNSYKFSNISLEAGFKQVLTTEKKYNLYYTLGGRLEYTLKTNFESRGQFSVYNLVSDEFVNKWNYGVSIGGGFQHDLSPTKQIFIELVASPDASRQYYQPGSLTVVNPNPSPFNPSETITISPQEVRNISLEFKIGIKFLQGALEEYEE